MPTAAGRDATQSPTIWSVGHSNRSLEAFLEVLRSAHIGCVVDVRRHPVSRFPQFGRAQLACALQEAGIAYHWLGEALGGYRAGGYQRHMRGEQFAAGLRELERLAGEVPTAFMCAEKLPWRCHRMHIADALTRRGLRVVHLIEADRIWEPTGRQGALEL
ncbi:MAG: DUF488 family protein [Armatimonadota bacterium]